VPYRCDGETVKRSRIIIVLCALSSTVACSLLIDPNKLVADVGQGDGAGPDAVVTPGDAAKSDAPITPTDGGIDADAAPKCASTTITDSFAELDGGSWVVIADLSNAPYPKIETTSEGPALALVAPDAAAMFSLGAVYISKPITIHAFDVTFRYLMTCPAEPCSDGLAVLWLDATDAGTTPLATQVSTGTFAIPPGMNGAAVAFDVYQNAGANDPVPPIISTLAIDGTKTPVSYDWHTKNVAYPALVGNRTVALTLRNGMIEVKVDGTSMLTGPVHAGVPAWFGFGASQGPVTGLFEVKSFSGTFYECDDP